MTSEMLNLLLLLVQLIHISWCLAWAKRLIAVCCGRWCWCLELDMKL